MTVRSRVYYAIKPFLPRSVQIALRGAVARRRYRGFQSVWPIDPRCGAAPRGWSGWPSGRRFALVLTHDVENVRGMGRCLRVAHTERDLGFASSFNFVPERYRVLPRIREQLVEMGFEIGVHDLQHDGRLYHSRPLFSRRAAQINRYLQEWRAVGFRSGSMHHNLEWIKELRVEWDSSTFDTDPFEPQSDGLGMVFPLWIEAASPCDGYVELPYTIPQDMTVFVLLNERSTRLWRQKLDWIVEKGGMALLNTHPDYMSWGPDRPRVDEYAHELYSDFLSYVKERYAGQYWQPLPREIARYWKGMAGAKPSDRAPADPGGEHSA